MRSLWVALALKFHIPIRSVNSCASDDYAEDILVGFSTLYAHSISLATTTSIEHAMRLQTSPRGHGSPLRRLQAYESDFEAPAVDEGFDEVRAVNFKFEGSAEQRAKWDMWLLDK